MAKTLLANTFGIESRCFVCAPENAAGLRQPFYLDDDRGTVVAQFAPKVDHSGAPNYAHGGVVMAILDEAMAWAVIAIQRRFGVTERAEVEFFRPVRVGIVHHVSATVVGADGRKIVARADVRDAAGAVCARATARFHVIDMQQAIDAAGAGAVETAEFVAAPP